MGTIIIIIIVKSSFCQFRVLTVIHIWGHLKHHTYDIKFINNFIVHLKSNKCSIRKNESFEIKKYINKNFNFCDIVLNTFIQT